METKTKIIAIVGKSGSGKDTLCNGLCARYKGFNKIVQNSTRPKRSYEVDGKDYNFLTKKEFRKEIYLEKSNFNHWRYGTPLTSIEEGQLNVGVFSPKTIRQLRRKAKKFDYGLDIFFLDRDNRRRLLSQLSRDDLVDVKEVIRRYRTDEKDFKNFKIKFNPVCTFVQEDLSFIADFIASYYELKE